MRRIAWIVSLVVLLPTAPAWTQEVSGTWEASGEITFTLVVERTSDGLVGGRLSGDGMALDLEGTTEPAGFSGTLAGGGVSLALTARFEGSRLRLEMVDRQELGSGDGSVMVLKFRRLAPPDPAVPVADLDSVVVNGATLSPAETALLERQHRVSIEIGAYWYDTKCGAWGLEGGPTAGFILAGLPLGGPLGPRASAGDTGVFVNGRELHEQDVAALEAAIGTVVPGRYWLDAEGDVGLEGGPTVFNLIRLARATSGGGNEPAPFHSKITGIGAGGSAGHAYVMGKDRAVVVAE